MPTDDRQGVYNIGIGEQTLGVSDKTLDYLVENITKYNLMSTEASIASFGRGNQDFPVLLMFPRTINLKLSSLQESLGRRYLCSHRLGTKVLKKNKRKKLIAEMNIWNPCQKALLRITKFISNILYSMVEGLCSTAAVKSRFS